MLLLIAIILFTANGMAQCIASTGATYSVTASQCRGTGSLSVTSVAGSTAPFEYALFDSINNTIEKPWQADSVFINVDGKKYTLRIRSVCGGGYSPEFIKSGIVVPGAYISVAATGTSTTALCTDGTITINASNGNTVNSGYQYAIVPSLSEPEPVTNYYRIKQGPNVFSGLAAGNYFVRTYDGCNGFFTTPVTVGSFNQILSVSAAIIYYKCADSLVMTVSAGSAGNVRISSKNRFVITYYDGTTDTIPVPASLTASKTIAHGKIITGTNSFKVKFIDSCGIAQEVTKTWTKPKINLLANYSGDASCNTAYVQINAPGSGILYRSTDLVYISIDSGRTWQNFTNSGIANTIVPKGITIQIWYRDCLDTVKAVVTTPALKPVLFSMLEYNIFSCNGNSGIVISSSQINGNSSSLKILSSPAGQAAIPDFTLFDNTRLFNLVPGKYVVQLKDGCNVSKTDSITLVRPQLTTLELSNISTCNAISASIKVKTTNRNFRNGIGYNNYNYVMVYNNANQLVAETDMVDSTIIAGLLPGQSYRVSLEISGYPSYSRKSICPFSQNITTNSFVTLSLEKALFSLCANSSKGTIYTVAKGGGGGYQYFLYKDSLSSSSLIAGPSATSTFDNLDANTTYVVAATDACGSRTTHTASFSTTNPPIAIVTPQSSTPELGKPVVMSVDSLQGAVYEWKKAGVAIAGPSSWKYNIQSLSYADTGQYTITIQLGTCIINSSAVQLRVAGILPVNLLKFSVEKISDHETILRWQVNAEVELKGYEMERSTDGIHFGRIGSIASKGYTDYSFLDKSPANGNNYYRLKMLDKNGQFKYSDIQLLYFGNAIKTTVRMFPNPALGQTTIIYGGEHGTGRIEIINATGTVVKAVSISQSATQVLDIRGLFSGAYLVKVASRNGVWLQKLIVR